MPQELRLAMADLASEASMPVYVPATSSNTSVPLLQTKRPVHGTTTMTAPAKQGPVHARSKDATLREVKRVDAKAEHFSARRCLQLRATEQQQSPVIASIPVEERFDVLQVKGSQAYVLYKGHIGWISIESDVGVRTVRGRESGTTIADLRAIEQGEPQGSPGSADDKASALSLQPDAKRELSSLQQSGRRSSDVDVYVGLGTSMVDPPPRRNIFSAPGEKDHQIDPVTAFYEFARQHPTAGRETDGHLQNRLNEMLAARRSKMNKHTGNRQPEVTQTNSELRGDIPVGLEQHGHPQPAAGSVCQSPEWRGVPGVVYSYGGPMEPMPRMKAAVADRGSIPVSVSYGIPHKSHGLALKPGELGLPSKRPRRRDLLFETENIDRRLALASLDDALRKGMACALFRACLARVSLVCGFRALKEANMHNVFNRQSVSPKVRENLRGRRDERLQGGSIYNTYLNALLSEIDVAQHKMYAESQDISAQYG